MNSESMLINSAGSIACGIFSVIMIFFFIGLPTYNSQDNNLTVIKGSRPYKLYITETDSSNPHPDFYISRKESQFSSIITQAADKHDVDPALVRAIIMAESAYNPMATSKKGAVGLMQIMPQTAATLGMEDMYNPVHNINAGVKYLKKLLNQFGGDLELTLAAYNAGSTKVMEYQGVPPYKATRHYVEEVFKYYRHYQGA